MNDAAPLVQSDCVVHQLLLLSLTFTLHLLMELLDHLGLVAAVGRGFHLLRYRSLTYWTRMSMRLLHHLNDVETISNEWHLRWTLF